MTPFLASRDLEDFDGPPDCDHLYRPLQTILLEKPFLSILWGQLDASFSLAERRMAKTTVLRG
jgi:hypothetical protein